MSQATQIISTALRMPEPIKKLDREEFREKLGIGKNKAYELEKLGQLIPPKKPISGPGYWMNYEASAYQLADWSSADFAELTESLLLVRSTLPEKLIPVLGER